jgi:hypothetical protein
MPFISDAQLAKVQGFVAKQKARANSAKEKAEEKAGEMKGTLECVGAAAAMGYVRGKREDAAGVWNAPFVKFDMELLTGLSLVGLAFFDVFGKYDDDVLNMGNGILAHYSGQVMRKMAKTGSFALVAGTGANLHERAGIGALPQHDPTSFNPTQMGSPYADPVAAALDESGV